MDPLHSGGGRVIDFHLFGVRRSGTNYAQVVLESNLIDFKIADFESKHDLPEYSDDGIIWLFNVKNPYSNTLSKAWFHSRIYELKDTAVTKELAHKFMTQDILSPKSIERIERWLLTVKDRHEKYREILEQHPETTRLIRYEDILESPTRVVNEFAEDFGLEIQDQHGRIRVPVQVEMGRPGLNREFYKKFYLSEAWRNETPAAIREVVDTTLDWETQKFLGYGQWKDSTPEVEE